jgi:carbon-monoxide dehydrogenase large subunit
MGEGGSINAPAALVSAVNDALSHLGIRANQTPLSPEWVAGAISSASAQAERPAPA